MSPVWPADHSRQASRWLIPAFDCPPSAPKVEPPLPEIDPAEQLARLAALEGEAESRGYATGFAAGMKDGMARAEALASALQNVLAALSRPLAIADAEMEKVLVAMTLECGRRIAQQELATEPAKVAAVVRDAVAALGAGARGITVYLHPGDYAAVAQVLGSTQESVEGWRLVADPETLSGGCRVESEQASVMASLDARAAGLAHTLLANT